MVKVGETYYVWYTKRATAAGPVGFERQSDTLPAMDWDLADIWYATSKDGFNWEEQGVAVARAPKGQYGDRSLTTPSVLVYRGKYYLYYQTFTTRWERNDCVGASMAWAGTPDGPWQRLDRPVVPRGGADDWDGRGITWGLCHIHPLGVGIEGGCYLARFDCDLSRDVDRPEFKRNNRRMDEDTYFQRVLALPEAWRAKMVAEQAMLDRETSEKRRSPV